MHTLMTNIAHNTLRDGTTNTHKKCLKTTNMADMRDRRTGREMGLRDK